MAKSPENCLVVAISSRALFNFEEENLVFDAGDEETYMKTQLDRLDIPASPGVGFNLCRKLLGLNPEDATAQPLTEVVVLSRNDPISGLRVFKSAEHHKIGVTRGAFLRGGNPYPYLEPLCATLFLSANPADVSEALKLNIPAANVFPRDVGHDPHPSELRIAFDGDSVLFSDEAERVYQHSKMTGFMAHESAKASEPLPAGPLKPFLSALHKLQKSLPNSCPISIKTALVTARGAPSHERALRTLMSWGVEVDNAFFLDGWPKTGFLEKFQPDFFFDDQLRHIDPAKALIPSGHVPYGIANELTAKVE
ncbi:MAG: 5'-nucleotidase [Armatimonadetes bacterium]|nr:5'-nucleotidase [Armatimonadota bacterium]